MHIHTLILIILMSSLTFNLTRADSFEDYLTEPRRKEQFPTEPAHLYVPLPYSMPGIGSGYFLMAYLSNINQTTTDAAIISVQGDASGFVTQIDEIPLIKNHLLLQLFDLNISKAAVNEYKTRGMDSNENDFNILEVDDVHNISAELTLNFMQRRLAFIASYSDDYNEIAAIRDVEGNILNQFTEPQVNEGIRRSYAAMIDLTDDYLDPKKGFRFHLGYQDNPTSDLDNPDYYVLDYSLLYHLPVNFGDTLVFNYYQSDAHVRRTGSLDADAIRNQQLSYSNCTPTDTACLDTVEQRVQNTLAHNRYGTASALGGTDRLRSYPDGRFSGGHMAFAGIEFRSNFVQEATPFDYFIWKDVRTSLQLALFAEVGTVAETSSELWNDTRYSYGIGARLLSASGSVYRADWATGEEGAEITIFFFYPW